MGARLGTPRGGGTVNPFHAAPVLAQLKDFQRATVEAVFDRIYVHQPGTRRFLVADEVGLGKTFVARGVIARTIEQLQDRVERIDVVYVLFECQVREAERATTTDARAREPRGRRSVDDAARSPATNWPGTRSTSCRSLPERRST